MYHVAVERQTCGAVCIFKHKYHWPPRHVTLTPVRNPMTPERLLTSYTFHVLTVLSKLMFINLNRAQLPVGKGSHDIMIIVYVLGLITWKHWADFNSSYKQGRNIKRLPRRKRVSITKNRLMACGWKLLDDSLNVEAAAPYRADGLWLTFLAPE